jgi:rhamnose transport system permease protein
VGADTILGTMLRPVQHRASAERPAAHGQPAELSGILTGVLLVATIVVDMLTRQRKRGPVSHHRNGARRRAEFTGSRAERSDPRGRLDRGGDNWMLVSRLRDGDPDRGRLLVTAVHGRRTVRSCAMMPRRRAIPTSSAPARVPISAAAALGVELLWDGPTDLDPAKQNEVVEAWITRGVDAIAVSVENKEAISTVLRKARAKGIKVVTWDADAEKDARDFFVNQATPQGSATRSPTKRAHHGRRRASSRSSPPASARRTRTSGSSTFASDSLRGTPT